MNKEKLKEKGSQSLLALDKFLSTNPHSGLK